MKKALFLLFFIPLSFYAQDKISFKKFHSNYTNEDRILKIYLPESYDKDKERRYPMTILLDAEYLFDIYVANSKLLALKDEAPEQIIVGVMQSTYRNQRMKDCDFSTETGLPTEESEPFYGFIRNELVPYIEDNYRTSLFKTIAGNTFTANFINYFFLEPKHVFNAYININPTYAPNMPEKLEAKSQTLTEDLFYYVSNGSYLKSEKRKAINNVINLLKLSEVEKFHFKSDNFTNTTRTASIGQSIPSALAFIYKPYGKITKEEFDKEITDMSPADAIAFLEKKYVEIDYLFGANLKIREQDIYRIEPIIIDKENGDYLEEFGKMINRLYPESPLGDYYIGLYYETGYDYKKALKYYKNGYAKIKSDNPNGDAYYKNIERVLEKRRAQKLGLPVEGEQTDDNPDNEN